MTCAVGTAAAADYYVAPTGSDSAAGSMAAPWATLSKAASTASAGDTVYFRAGTYPIRSQTRFTRSGTSDTNRIRLLPTAPEWSLGRDFPAPQGKTFRELFAAQQRKKA